MTQLIGDKIFIMGYNNYEGVGHTNGYGDDEKMTPIKEVIYKEVRFNENAYLEELAEESELFEFNEEAYLIEQMEREELLEADEQSDEDDRSTQL